MEEGRTGLDSLEIWQVAVRFTVDVCRIILPLLPPEEKWGMATQLRRSVQSIPANIAEGYGRFYFTETIRFCYIARGSLEETYSHLTLAVKLGYLTEKDVKSIFGEIVRMRQMINGYIAFLKRSKRGEKEPGALPQAREMPGEYLIWDDDLSSDPTNTESTITGGQNVEGIEKDLI